MAQKKWQKSRVFITGATGLLGCSLTKTLVEQGAEVVALVRDSVPKSLFFSGWNLAEKVNIVRGEIEDFNVLERAINEYEIDTVFHLAAQTIVGTANRGPLATFKANIEGTWNILEACRLHQRNVRRVVVASSDKAYGNLEGQAYDESFPLRGEHPYDVSKSCADLIARSFFVTYGLPVAVTRCGNFFGPGDLNFSRLVPGTIRDLLKNEAPVIRSDGKFIRDYIYVQDGAEAYMQLAQAMDDEGGKVRFAGEAFNFSYGLRLNVLDMVATISKLMKKEIKPNVLNQASHEIPVQCLNSNKAKELLTWKPRFGLEEGLKHTIAWYTEALSHAKPH